MINQASKNWNDTQLPTLWLDNRNAWRQSEDAIIIPISYRSLEFDQNETATEIAQPVTQPIAALSEVSDLDNLPDPDSLEGLFTKEEEPPAFQSFFLHVPERSFIHRTRHLSVAVPMLLLGVIALVVFAWMTFR